MATITDTSVATRPMTPITWAAVILLIIGGLNWALVGLFSFDLVAALFGPMSLLSRLVYILVGIAALYALIMPLSRPRVTI